MHIFAWLYFAVAERDRCSTLQASGIKNKKTRSRVLQKNSRSQDSSRKTCSQQQKAATEASADAGTGEDIRGAWYLRAWCLTKGDVNRVSVFQHQSEPKDLEQINQSCHSGQAGQQTLLAVIEHGEPRLGLRRALLLQTGETLTLITERRISQSLLLPCLLWLRSGGIVGTRSVATSP